jgi:hypothetical protein
MDAREKERLKLIGCSDKEIARKEQEERIDKALLTYRRENLRGPGQLTKEDWDQVYKNAGMSDKEIAEYRKQNELTPEQAKALDDKVEQFNS